MSAFPRLICGRSAKFRHGRHEPDGSIINAIRCHDTRLGEAGVLGATGLSAHQPWKRSNDARL